MNIKELFEKSKTKYEPKTLMDLSNTDLARIIVDKAYKTKEIIVRDCGPWLSQTDNGRKYVYRGLPDTTGILVAKKAVRENRISKDSSLELTKILNMLIKEKGLVANRTNSIFVTGSRGIASNYGDIFVTLPCGEFNYTWHTKISDAFEKFEAHANENKSSIEDIVRPKMPDVSKSEIEKIKKKLDRKYRKRAEFYKDLIDELNILLKRKGTALKKEYSAQINKYKKELEDFKTSYKADLENAIENLNQRSIYDVAEEEDFEIDLTYPPTKKFLMGFKGDDNTLQQAISSKNEIMIKCRHALYVHPLFYTKFVLPILQEKEIKLTPSVIGYAYEIAYEFLD